MIRTSLSALVGLALATTAGAQSFTIPQVVDFTDPTYADFHAHVAENLAGTLADGRLVVTSQANPGSCRITKFALTGEAARTTFAQVQVDLAPGQDENGDRMLGAGLILRHSDDGGTRFLALLAAGSGYQILAFDAGNIGQRIGGTLDGIEPGAVLSLAAREIGGGGEFFVNGQRVGSLSDSRIGGTGLGLIHCGAGTFAFDDWGLNTRADLGFDPDAPPPPPDPDEDEDATPEPSAGYWYEADGQPQGPVGAEEIRRLIAEGRITARTLIWTEGLPNWVAAQDHGGFTF